MKAIAHREVIATITTVTISHESTGKYYASILTDDGVALVPPLRHLDHVVGIDLGLKDTVTQSDSRKTANPHTLRRSLKTLRRKQQSLSRKIEAAKRRCASARKPVAQLRDYFGPNIAKARWQVARTPERVRCAPEDWQHKTARPLADENQAVCAETLNVKGMMRNRKRVRAIADGGWSGLMTKLDCKLRDKGGHLARIDRLAPSSKTRWCCGAKNETLKLSDRFWACLTCGTVHDRDINAAINIRNRWIWQLKAAGLPVSAQGSGVNPARRIGMVAACEAGSSAL